MKKYPKVSVMFPSYNHAAFINEALQSVINQTFRDFEIVFSDDGSLDNTMNIVNTFKDNRLIVHRFESNQGASINGIYIYAQCHGELIALCNSDDVWHPEHLEVGVRYLDTHPDCGAVFSWVELIDETGTTIEKCCDVFKQQNKSKEEWSRYLFTNGNCLCHPSVIIRKKVYEDMGFYHIGLRQLPDFYMWTQLVKKYEIYVCPDILVKHRRHIATLLNTSAPLPDNSIRDINESSYILKHYFDGMSDEYFITAFSCIFRDKSARSHEELICEKFFILHDDKYYMKKISLPVAHSFFLEICGQENVVQTLENKYNYSLHDFWNFGSTIDLYCIRPNGLGYDSRMARLWHTIETALKGKNNPRLKKL